VERFLRGGQGGSCFTGCQHSSRTVLGEMARMSVSCYVGFLNASRPIELGPVPRAGQCHPFIPFPDIELCLPGVGGTTNGPALAVLA